MSRGGIRTQRAGANKVSSLGFHRAISAAMCLVFAFWGTQTHAQTSPHPASRWVWGGDAEGSVVPKHLRLLQEPLRWFSVDVPTHRADGSDVPELDEDAASSPSPPRNPLRMGALAVSRQGVTPMGKSIGVGLEGGSPTAITARYAWSASEGIVVGAGSMAGPYWNTPTLSVHVDYLWHPSVLLRTPVLDLSWYIGGGAAVVVGERLRSIVPIITPWVPVAYGAFGARFPIGITLALQRLPVELYLQGNPSFFVFPGLSVWMGGSAGFRFYL